MEGVYKYLLGSEDLLRGGCVDTPACRQRCCLLSCFSNSESRKKGSREIHQQGPMGAKFLNNLGAEVSGSAHRHLPLLQQDCTGECGWKIEKRHPYPSPEFL